MKVSLGVVLVTIIVIVAMISGVLALVPLLEASKSSSFDIASDFSETISDRISVRVQATFEDIQIGVDIIQRAINGSAVVPDSRQSVMGWMGSVIAPAGNAQRSFYCLDDGSFVVLIVLDSSTTILGTVTYNATTNTSETGTFNTTNEVYTANVTAVGRDLLAGFWCQNQAYYSLIRTQRSWTPLFLSDTFSVDWPHLIAGAPILDPKANFTTRGAFGFELSAQRIQQYLQTLGIAGSGVAALVSGTNRSIVALRLQSDIDVEGTIMDSATGERRLWYLSEVPNDVVQRSYAAFGEAFYTCAPPCRRQQGDGYLSTLFVRVTEPYESYGLELRLLLAIPSSDFLEGIQSSIVIGALSAAGGIVFLATVSALLLFTCLKPLHHLEQRLYAIEVLREDASHSAPSSFLREIYNIEVAYASMRSELIKMKSFLPQSVLRQLEEELAEEEGDGRSGDFMEDEEHGANNNIAHQQLNQAAAPGEGSIHLDDDEPMLPKMDRPAPEDAPNRPFSANPLAGLNNNPPTELSTSVIPLPANPITASVDGGLTAVNPLKVLNTANERGGDDVSQGGAAGMSIRTEFVNLALTERRKKRANRPTLQSLNDLCVLSAKRITVVMANCIGFHSILESHGPQGIELFHANLVDIVLKEVNATGGVLDFVHGDRFLITYNASTTCIPHGICAAEMVMRVRAKLEDSPDLLGFQGIRFGLSAGEALCGNFGNDVMKRFSAVGPVVHQAFTLMQQTKAEEGHCHSHNLCCAAVYGRIRQRVAAEHVNYVQLPGQANAGLISTIRGPRHNNEPLESLLSRTRVGARRRNNVNEQSAIVHVANNNNNNTLNGDGGGVNSSLPLFSAAGGDGSVRQLTVAEIEHIDNVNHAFETFANGDIEAARELAEALPGGATAALRKAFQVCE